MPRRPERLRLAASRRVHSWARSETTAAEAGKGEEEEARGPRLELRGAQRRHRAEEEGAENVVVVVSKSRELLFMPSLIGVPFGLRMREDISSDIAPTCRSSSRCSGPPSAFHLACRNRTRVRRDGEDRGAHVLANIAGEPLVSLAPE
jgi:hypothetical protein